MFYLDLDNQVYPVIERMLSGCLPHENYDSSSFVSILLCVENYVKLEEMKMEYYVMFEWLKNIKSIATSISGSPYASKDVFELSVENNLDKLCDNYFVGLKKYLTENGINFNPEIDSDYENGCNILYNRCIDLYDRLFDMKVSSKEALNHENNLRDVFLANAVQYSIEQQVIILNGHITLRKKRYVGAVGAHEFSCMINNEITNRLDVKSSKLTIVDDLEESVERKQKMKDTNVKICDFGIPSFDDFTPMTRNTLDIWVARPGLCKTTLFCSLTAKLLLAGCRVLFISGETTAPKVENSVLASYITQKRDVMVTYDHVMGKVECPESIERLINIERANMCESGLLSIRPAITYEDTYQDLKSIYEVFPFDAVFLDHSLAMKGNQPFAEKIDKLSTSLRAFKLDYPVYVGVASHPTPEAAKELAEGRNPTKDPTKWGAILTGESDSVIIMDTNTALRGMSCVWCSYYKRREGPPLDNTVVLSVDFACKHVFFEPEKQRGTGEISVSSESALESLVDDYDDNDDFDDYDD